MSQSTRATVPQRVWPDEIEWGTLATQETTYGTALATGEIATHLRMQAEIIAINRELTFQSNADEVKGSEWPTTQYEQKRNLAFDYPARLSSENAALFASLALGDTASAVQETDKYYLHTITPQVVTAAQAAGNGGYSQPPPTSIRYKDGPTQNIAHGICVNELTVEGLMGDFAKINVSCIGSGQVTTDANSFQAIEAEQQLKLHSVQVGVAASEENISSAIEGCTVGWTNDIREDDSWYPGSGLYRGQALMGVRMPNISLKFKQHSTDTELTNYLANNALKAIITFRGADIADTAGPSQYNMVWTFWQLKYNARAQSASGNYKLNEMEFHCEDDGTNGILDITVNNDDSAYLALAA
jgi:hypothetical protein